MFRTTLIIALSYLAIASAMPDKFPWMHPYFACITKMPVYEYAPKILDKGTYRVVPEKMEFSPGETIAFYVDGNNPEDKYRGLFLTVTEDGRSAGEWMPQADFKFLSCDGATRGAITEESTKEKKAGSHMLMWKAPDCNKMSEYTMRATVIKGENELEPDITINLRCVMEENDNSYYDNYLYELPDPEDQQQTDTSNYYYDMYGDYKNYDVETTASVPEPTPDQPGLEDQQQTDTSNYYYDMYGDYKNYDVETTASVPEPTPEDGDNDDKYDMKDMEKGAAEPTPETNPEGEPKDGEDEKYDDEDSGKAEPEPTAENRVIAMRQFRNLIGTPERAPPPQPETKAPNNHPFAATPEGIPEGDWNDNDDKYDHEKGNGEPEPGGEPEVIPIPVGEGGTGEPEPTKPKPEGNQHPFAGSPERIPLLEGEDDWEDKDSNYNKKDHEMGSGEPEPEGGMRPEPEPPTPEGEGNWDKKADGYEKGTEEPSPPEPKPKGMSHPFAGTPEKVATEKPTPETWPEHNNDAYGEPEPKGMDHPFAGTPEKPGPETWPEKDGDHNKGTGEPEPEGMGHSFAGTPETLPEKHGDHDKGTSEPEPEGMGHPFAGTPEKPGPETWPGKDGDQEKGSEEPEPKGVDHPYAGMPEKPDPETWPEKNDDHDKSTSEPEPKGPDHPYAGMPEKPDPEKDDDHDKSSGEPEPKGMVHPFAGPEPTPEHMPYSNPEGNTTPEPEGNMKSTPEPKSGDDVYGKTTTESADTSQEEQSNYYDAYYDMYYEDEMTEDKNPNKDMVSPPEGEPKPTPEGMTPTPEMSDKDIKATPENMGKSTPEGMMKDEYKDDDDWPTPEGKADTNQMGDEYKDDDKWPTQNPMNPTPEKMMGDGHGDMPDSKPEGMMGDGYKDNIMLKPDPENMAGGMMDPTPTPEASNLELKSGDDVYGGDKNENSNDKSTPEPTSDDMIGGEYKDRDGENKDMPAVPETRPKPLGLGAAKCANPTYNIPEGASTSFERDDYGAWRNSSNAELMWRPHMGRTPSPNTGPNWAYNGQNYLYMEGSRPARMGYRAILMGPRGLRGCFCIKFACHMMVDPETKIELRVNGITINSNSFSHVGWQVMTTTIDNPGESMIEIVATAGSTFRSDVAVDDIKVTQGMCPEDM